MGDTTRLPLASTAPTPLMLTSVAPSVVQESVEASPAEMLVGAASKRMMRTAGAVGVATVTVTSALMFWLRVVAVSR